MKEIPKIHEGEYRFCLILWENEPISAAQLAKLCFAELGELNKNGKIFWN